MLMNAQLDVTLVTSTPNVQTLLVLSVAHVKVDMQGMACHVQVKIALFLLP